MEEDSAHKKAEKFQNFLVSKYEEFFPEKVISISSDDQPFISTKLKRMKRENVVNTKNIGAQINGIFCRKIIKQN